MLIVEMAMAVNEPKGSRFTRARVCGRKDETTDYTAVFFFFFF